MYRRPWPPLNPYAMRYLPPGTQPQGPFGPPVFRPSAPRFPVPPPYGLGPPVHSFQRTLNQWPQRGISHQPLIQRPTISETTSLNLTVQTSSDFSVVNRWNSWLAETEHRLLAHRQCTRKGVPSLPEIRARFLQWKQLIEMLRSARSDACESNNLAYETELTQLETECSASDLVNCIRRRVRQVAKKRRYKSRVRKRQQELNDDGVVVLRTSTLSVLERLRNCPSPKHHSSQPRKHDPSTIAKTQRTPVKRLHRPTATSSEVIRIKQALSECRERLALLDSLERLRAARISQARQRGGLFPEAFDRAFSAQFNEIRSILRTQLKKLMDVEKTQNVTSSQGIVKEQQNPDNSMSLCCDHWPDLPTAWKQVLFHASETPQGVPWRWTRFYHQADFDFADFLRIRTTWDSYLVQSTNAERASGDAAEKTPASVLPDSWDLPIDLETMNTAWRSFISFDSETTASSA
ncbi:hypothetical protein D915_006166 [Fasciola hepatica]|uniref:Uncharacterized protein n=1 Tax=Fasciola hepatica TaxID=6192 RepID=A0A4E0RQJ8_FASHE|nr:hypothetical protein D915_006166 [Fasciola hepatica]